jgi:hypothetical protein
LIIIWTTVTYKQFTQDRLPLLAESGRSVQHSRLPSWKSRALSRQAAADPLRVFDNASECPSLNPRNAAIEDRFDVHKARLCCGSHHRDLNRRDYARHHIKNSQTLARRYVGRGEHRPFMAS